MATESNAPVVVEAVALQKVFYDFWHRPKASAVNSIDFTVRRGEILGFLGPNGAGKSTTVKMILGLLRPTSGTLKVFDRPPSDVKIKVRIGYLPEETYLYKYLTAEETLEFFGSLFRLPNEQKKKRIKELLQMVGMTGAAKRPVGEFSKGMSRRIGLAQALINDPDLVVLDEPTSGLDPIGCKEIKDIIRTLARRGKTVILCSHLLADVQDICDNVLIMYGGRVRAQGELTDLLRVQEKTRITVPKLAPDLLQRLLDLLQTSGLAEADATVDAPTMSLEEFFLDVVNKARREQAATSGVEQSGQIASFLAEDSETAAATNKILKDLLDEKEPTPEPEPVDKPEEEPHPDLQRLEELAKVIDEPKPEPETDDKAQTELSAEEKAAKSKAINDLLNKGKE